MTIDVYDIPVLQESIFRIHEIFEYVVIGNDNIFYFYFNLKVVSKNLMARFASFDLFFMFT